MWLHNVTGVDVNKVTVTEAAKLAGISRQHLYRSFINTGKISISKEIDKVYIEFSELLRVFPDIKHVTHDGDNMLHQVTVKCDKVTSVDNEVIILLKAQLAEAKEREHWLINQINELRQQQNNLIEHKVKVSDLPKPRKKFLGIF